MNNTSTYKTYIHELSLINNGLIIGQGYNWTFSRYDGSYETMEDNCKSMFICGGTVKELKILQYNAIPVAKYSGFATETKALGEAGIVRTFGELTGFTGLKKGQPVYIDKDGNKTHNLTPIKAGKASSATALVIQ